MSGIIAGKRRHTDIEVVPRTLAAVPSGADGQVAVVTDRPGIRLAVREGGVLLPSVSVRESSSTTSWIEMTVDPTAGTSPPAGTLVHNQAEYDALGYDLLYAQDALDILPLILRHGVVIKLRGGAHAGRYDRTGGDNGYDTWVYFPDFLVDVAEAYYGDLDYREIGIYLEGEDVTNIGSPVACTWDLATRAITRDSGTWTAHAHDGQLLIVTEGVLAGTIMPIDANDTTSLYTAAPDGSGTSSLTVQIFTPSAVVSGVSTLLASAPEPKSQYPLIVDVKNVNLQSNYDLRWYGQLGLQYCMVSVANILLRQDPLDLLQTGLGFSTTFHYSAVVLPWSSRGFIVFGGGITTDHVSIRGHNSALGTPATPVVRLMDGYFYSIRSVYGPKYEAVPALAGPVLWINGGQMVGANYSEVDGNGLSTGVLLDGGSLVYQGTDIPWVIKGHAVAVKAVGNKLAEVNGLNAGSTGNTKGWDISGGAQVLVVSPATIAATGDKVTIDGQTEAYTSLAASGDAIIGPKGSILRRA